LIAVAVERFGGVIGRGLSQILEGARGVRVVAVDLDCSGLQRAVAGGDVGVVILGEESVSTPLVPGMLRGASPGGPHPSGRGIRSLPDVGLVGLVHRPTRAYATRMLGYGVSVCLSTESSPAEVLRGVRLAAEGGSAFVSMPPRSSLSSARADRLARVVGKHVLTRRERQVLELLGKGQRNADIADQLQISTETAKTHVKHVYCKLGVRSRAELLEG